MNIGLIGCGNMARAMARGWGRPVLCFDPVADRARSLAEETGGEALASGAAVAEQAELVVLCHKPAQLNEVARELAPHAKAVASILAATPLADLKSAYEGLPVYRFLPSLPVEVRVGAVVQAADPEREPLATLTGDPAIDLLVGEIFERDEETLDLRVHALFAELGTLVTLDDALIDVAMGLMSCAPAYIALIAEAQVDAGVRRGIPPAQASVLVTETLAGTAELLRRRDYDTLAVRREVTSPGGTTARGLAALERGGVRAAFSDALDAVLGYGKGSGRRSRGPGPRDERR
ncbi:MAG TPA: pyrroline-5-carboxylate reductase dimerization domain-containing protein [Solirubrobacteraceae bacterium]